MNAQTKLQAKLQAKPRMKPETKLQIMWKQTMNKIKNGATHITTSYKTNYGYRCMQTRVIGSQTA